jgi:hypothetical protein
LQKTVVKPTTPSAARVGVTSVAYNTTGKLLAAGMADGAIQVNTTEHNTHTHTHKKPAEAASHAVCWHVTHGLEHKLQRHA